MPEWLNDVLIALASSAGALTGAYLAGRVTSRQQLSYTRRTETTETILALLYELSWDFTLWLDPRGIAGRPKDKRTEATWILGKLNRLNSYRSTRSMWLDPWVDPEVTQRLDATLRQLGHLHGGYFNAMPKTHLGDQVPESNRYKEAREQLERWLEDELPLAVADIERGLIGSLDERSSGFWRRMFGG